MGSVDFEVDIGGVREFLHSGGVNAELQKIATGICEKANAAASTHVKGHLKKPAYKVYMDRGAYTTIAVVATASKIGAIDEKKNRTLRRQNHRAKR